MYQLSNQTDEQKKEMYMKLNKEELVQLLIEANKLVSNLSTLNIQPYTQPYQVYPSYQPYWEVKPEYLPYYTTICNNEANT